MSDRLVCFHSRQCLASGTDARYLPLGIEFDYDRLKPRYMLRKGALQRHVLKGGLSIQCRSPRSRSYRALRLSNTCGAEMILHDFKKFFSFFEFIFR